MEIKEVSKVMEQLKGDPAFEEYIKDIVLNQYLVYRMKGKNHELNIAPTAVVNNALFNLSCGNITVEDWAFFGHSVTVLTGSHEIDVFDKDRQICIPEGGRDVVIKRGAWIASNATIVGPCTISEHAVVGACSFVNKDVPPYAVVAGIPAKIIKYVKR